MFCEIYNNRYYETTCAKHVRDYIAISEKISLFLTSRRVVSLIFEKFPDPANESESDIFTDTITSGYPACGEKLRPCDISGSFHYLSSLVSQPTRARNCSVFAFYGRVSGIRNGLNVVGSAAALGMTASPGHARRNKS